MTESPRATRAACSWLLVLGLLMAQALGLAHRIGHGPALGSATFAAGQAQEKAQRFRADADAFGEHEPGSGECRLIDQAGQAEALLASVLPALPPRPVALAAAMPHRGAGAALIRAYLARGPPPGAPGLPLRA